MNEILVECCLLFRRFFLLMYNFDVELFYKNTVICIVVCFLDMTNSSEEDESGDELDFYDFLEIAAEKIDSITQQSMEERKKC